MRVYSHACKNLKQILIQMMSNVWYPHLNFQTLIISKWMSSTLWLNLFMHYNKVLHGLCTSEGIQSDAKLKHRVDNGFWLSCLFIKKITLTLKQPAGPIWFIFVCQALKYYFWIFKICHCGRVKFIMACLSALASG